MTPTLCTAMCRAETKHEPHDTSEGTLYPAAGTAVRSELSRTWGDCPAPRATIFGGRAKMVKNGYVLDETGPYCWKCEEIISCQGIHPVKVTKRPTFRLTRDRQPATELLCGSPSEATPHPPKPLSCGTSEEFPLRPIREQTRMDSSTPLLSHPRQSS